MGGNTFETGSVNAASGYGVGSSLPLIGDVNGDGMLDFVFLASVYLHCYTYNPATDLIELYWTRSTSDRSGGTGITLFDFNLDGKSELVYRDENNLQILDGSQRNNCVPVVIVSGVRAGTGSEYPIVADVNNDGAAEIVTIGASSVTSINGSLYVMGGLEGKEWAPARKVWNQYAYNTVNVNEDLTIPQRQFNPSTVFAGPDEILGTGDDVRPFNNFLQQQTILNQYGMPLWRIPDARITVTTIPTFSYNQGTDEMQITVQVTNSGGTPFAAPFHVTAYKDAVGDPTKFIYAYPNIISAGQTVTLSFAIPNFQAGWLPYSGIALKINDRGNGMDDQAVCESTKTEYVYDYRVITPTQQEICMDKNV